MTTTMDYCTYATHLRGMIALWHRDLGGKVQVHRTGFGPNELYGETMGLFSGHRLRLAYSSSSCHAQPLLLLGGMLRPETACR